MSSASVYCLFQAAPYEHLTICDPHPGHDGDDDHRCESDFKSNDCCGDRRVNDQSDRGVNLPLDIRTEEYTMKDGRSTDEGNEHDDDKCASSRKKYFSDSQKNEPQRCRDQRPAIPSKSDPSPLSKDIPFKHHPMMSADKHFLNMIKSRPKRPKVKPPRKVATHGSCSDDDKMNASQSCTNDCDDDKAAAAAATSESVRKSTVKSMTVQRGQENIDDMSVGIDCFFQSPSKLLERKKFGENINTSARGSLRNDLPISSEKSNQKRVKNEEVRPAPNGDEGNCRPKNMAHSRASGKIAIDIDPSKLLPGSDPRISVHMIKELKNRQKTTSTGPNSGGIGGTGSSAISQAQTSIINEMRERKNLLRSKGTSNGNQEHQQVSTKPNVCGKISGQHGETRDSQPVSPSSERTSSSSGSSCTGKVAIDARPEEKMSVKARASAFGSMLKPTGTRASSSLTSTKDGGMDSDPCDGTIDSGSKRTSMTSFKGHHLSKVTNCSRDGSRVTCESDCKDKNIPSDDMRKRPSGDESHDGGKLSSMGKGSGDDDKS